MQRILDHLGATTLEQAVPVLVARGQADILADIRDGRVPESVGSFSDLHDHVDANEYSGLCEEPFQLPSEADDWFWSLVNEVQDRLDNWLRNGLHRKGVK